MIGGGIKRNFTRKIIICKKNHSTGNMIFDIYGKEVGGKLVVDIPYHEFKWTDQISLRKVIID